MRIASRSSHTMIAAMAGILVFAALAAGCGEKEGTVLKVGGGGTKLSESERQAETVKAAKKPQIKLNLSWVRLFEEDISKVCFVVDTSPSSPGLAWTAEIAGPAMAGSKTRSGKTGHDGSATGQFDITGIGTYKVDVSLTGPDGITIESSSEVEVTMEEGPELRGCDINAP